MEDNCFVCSRNIASVTICNCQHRFLCPDCVREITDNALRANAIPQCPICRCHFSRTIDSTALQLHPMTITDGERLALDMRESFPYGSRLFVGGRCRLAIADEELITVVREAMHAVQASLLSYEQLEVALADRLTITQYQLVFAELIKEMDLHDVLRKVDRRQFATATVQHTVQILVKHTVEGIDIPAVVMRAVVGGGVSLGTTLAIGTSSFSQFHFSVNGVANLFIFTMFSALELYRWSTRDDVDATECLTNIGEHATGALAGYGGAHGGALVGAMTGAALGSVVPGLGTLIGGVIGGILGMLSFGMFADVLGRSAYRKCVSRMDGYQTLEEQEERVQRLSQQQVSTRAAERLGIDLSAHNFREAFGRYRQKLMLAHPDKAIFADEEEKRRLEEETRDIFACWVIVRGHYQQRGEVDNSGVNECAIMLNVLSVFEAATNQWNYARCWFGSLGLGRPLDHDTERISDMVLYI